MDTVSTLQDTVFNELVGLHLIIKRQFTTNFVYNKVFC